jgi:hypothetical protein
VVIGVATTTNGPGAKVWVTVATVALVAIVIALLVLIEGGGGGGVSPY